MMQAVITYGLKVLGAAGTQQGKSITVDKSGGIYVTGSFENTVDFDPGPGTVTHTSAGNQDVFILKLICNDTTSSYLSVELCADSYTLNGETYTAGGIYTQVFPNTSGCDSTVMLELALYSLNPPAITVDEYTLSVAGTYITYQWIKNGTDIDGATNATYTVTENADYQVRVTNDNGCEATSAVYEVNNVSINEAGGIAQYISVYPNPVNEVIHISSPVPVHIALTGADGRTVLSAEDARQVSVKHLPGGVYFLRVSDREGRLIKTEKVVKAGL
jgi:hypothetical protein